MAKPPEEDAYSSLALGFVAAGRETWRIYRRTLQDEERQKRKEK